MKTSIKSLPNIRRKPNGEVARLRTAARVGKLRRKKLALERDKKYLTERFKNELEEIAMSAVVESLKP